MSLAEKFEKVITDYDPYGFGMMTDEEKKLSLDLLRDDPYEVISQLLDIIDDLTE